MKQAESGYNECLKRSKNYIMQDEVRSLLEKFKGFNSESIDFIIKSFFIMKSIILHYKIIIFHYTIIIFHYEVILFHYKSLFSL